LDESTIGATADAGAGDRIDITADQLILSPSSEITARAGPAGIAGTVVVSSPQSALAIAASVALTSGAHATSRVFDPSRDPCTTVNCSSERISGTVGSVGVQPLSWTLHVFSVAQNCMRLEVTAEDVDLLIVVVAPNGTIFRNDDSGLANCPNCPLVKIGNTPNVGWYTVQVMQFAGAGTFGNFTMLYGVYPLNNPNCDAPTTPQSVRAVSTQKSLEPEEFDVFDSEGAPNE
jgi:hypothetical protein